MPFFDSTGKRKQGSNTKFDIEAAKRLYHAISQKKRLANKRLKDWADVIRRMRTIDQISKKRLKLAIKWYHVNIGKKFVPRIHTVEVFRRKFNSLEAAMNDSRGLESEITNHIKQLQEDRLPGFIWPNDEKKDELKFLQISFNNYSSLFEGAKRLWLWAEEHDPKEIMTSPTTSRSRPNSIHVPAENFYEVLKHPNELIVDWTFEVHRIAYEWDNWSGDLLGWVWRPELKRVRTDLVETVEFALSTDPDYSEELLDRLLEGIKNHAP